MVTWCLYQVLVAVMFVLPPSWLSAPVCSIVGKCRPAPACHVTLGWRKSRDFSLRKSHNSSRDLCKYVSANQFGLFACYRKWFDGDGTWCFLDMAHLGSWKMLQSNWNLCRSRWRTGRRSLQPPPDSLQREKAPPRPTRLRHFLKQRKLRRFGVSSDLRPTSATVFKLSIEIW